MRLDKLTHSFQTALADAQSLALGKNQQMIEPSHVLSVMLASPQSTVYALLNKLRANVLQLKQKIDDIVDKLPKIEGAAGDVHASNDLVRLLNIADQLAQKRNDQYIASELFLLAALQDKGAVGQVLKNAGITSVVLEAAIDSIRGGESVKEQGAESARQALDKYTRDLTQDAELGKLDPVIGRDNEIRRLIQVLQRRTKIIPS